MAILPGTQVTRSNVGLNSGISSPNKSLVVGPCNLGTPGQVYTFGQPAQVNATLGYGPAVTMAQLALQAGCQSIDVVPSSVSVAGSVTAVTSGSGYPAVTVSGTPYDAYAIGIAIAQAGNLGTSSFTFTLDGVNYSNPPLLTTASYAIPNSGLTLSFPAGTYATNQTWSATAHAPVVHGVDVEGAIMAYTGSSNIPYLVGVALHSSASADGFSAAQGLDAGLTALQNAEQTTCGVCPTGGLDSTVAGIHVATTDVINTFSAFSFAGQNGGIVVSERSQQLVPIGQGNWYSQPFLPNGFMAFATAAAFLQVSTGIDRKRNGALAGVSNPTYDERVSGNVYQQNNIVCTRTFKNSSGVYFTDSLCKIPAGSDFTYLEWVMVLNLATNVAQQALDNYVGSNVRTKTNGSGQIDGRDAAKIQNDVQSQLDAAIMQPLNAEGTKGYASAVVFTVDQTNNILASSTLIGNVALVPLAKIENVNLTLGFSTSTPVTPV